MTIELRSAASPNHVTTKLTTAAQEAQNLIGTATAGSDLHARYLDWVTGVVRMIRLDLSAKELDRLVTTRGHATLQAVNATNYPASLTERVVLELTDRQADLTKAADNLRREYDEWGQGAAVVVVLDTNILLQYFGQLADIDWNTLLNERTNVGIILAVPMKVVDELDGLKDRGTTSEVKKNARHALIMLERTFRYEMRREQLAEPVRTNARPQSGIFIKLIDDDLDHEQLAIADAEIVDRAMSIVPFASRVWVATNDTGMRFRARQVGLKVTRVRSQDLHVAPEELRQGQA